VRLIATAISSSAWRRTGASAGGSRQVLMKKENWPELTFLTSVFPVELPGIEPDALPGLLACELRFRYVSFQFSPARYLRFPSRVLTASRVGVSNSSPSGACPDRRVGTCTIRPNGLEVVCVVGLA
jgi:hypothetical protein